MILVMQSWKKIPPRIITNVVDVGFTDTAFVWKIGKETNKWRKGVPLDRFEARYRFVYVMGEDTYLFGAKDCLKWIVWKHFDVADLTDSQMAKHIRENPVDE